MVQINDSISSYTIIEEISRGGFGSVYKAKHRVFEDEPPVAIKVLHPHLVATQQHKQFFQEAQLLRRLKHKHILPILDAGIHQSSPFIITEYAELGSLKDCINRLNGKPFPVNDAVNILTQIGEALAYAHQQNVTHRDLKPENILFNANKEVLLADFGLAVMLASGRTGQVGAGGTIHYMAPEQFVGNVSMKSDLYALGCIAYELLTGKRPFVVEYSTIETMWYQHTKVDPIHPTQLNPAIPLYIAQAILIAMSKDRAHRYPDVTSFVLALQAPSQLSKTKEQWNEEGMALRRVQKYEKALLAFDSALQLDPNYVVAYNNKGYTLKNLRRYEEALLAFDYALRLNPNFAEAYNNKGIALQSLRRYEDALLAFDYALRLDPNFAVAYNNTGLVLDTLKRYDGALLAYDQALRLDPNFADAYYNKGLVLDTLKRYDEAVMAFEQVIRINPNDASAYQSKGNMLKRLGRKKEAQEAFAKAKELGYKG